MSKKNPADYVVGPDATIEDIDLDAEDVYYEGERLTEAKAAEIAEESARLAHEARAANLIPGRKSLSGEGKHSPVLNVRLPQSEFEKLDRLAERRGVRRSTLARSVLSDFIDEHTHELRDR